MSEAAPSTAAVATLHVFSGVHLGARIALTEGTWLLGSDDECDLILNGLAPHHAELQISTGDDGAVSVTAVPREGPLAVDGAKAEGETPLACGAAWYLGETCFAWNLPGAAQEDIVPSVFSAANVVAAAAETASADAAAPVDAAGNDGESADAEGATGAADRPERETLTLDGNLPAESDGFQPVRMDGSLRPPRVPWQQRLRRPLSLLLVAVLLCALSFAFSSGPGRSEYPAIVSGILQKAGLAGLAVSPRWPGVEVRGAVATPADLERLQQAVQNVSFPVYMEVAVDDDMLRAVRNAMGVRGFFPAVRMERGGEEPYLLVAAFMRDALVEADAFAQLEKDVPSPPAKRRRVVHEKDAAPHVLAALQNAGFGDIQPVYLPGRISLTGNLYPEREPALARLKAGLSARFGVPLFGEGVVEENMRQRDAGHGTALTPAAHTAPAQQREAAQQEENPLGDLNLTGVFIAPLTFVATADGRRMFPGAVLPNGNVLETITATELTLRRGDRVFIYRLRGNHE